MVEYVYEAMAKISVEFEYTDMYSFLIVEDYKTRLPLFLEDINQVSYIGNDITLVNRPQDLANVNRYSMMMALEPFYQDRSEVNMFPNNIQGYRYKVRDNYIHTTFREGLIEIAYRAFPVDDNLEPMIPDDIYFTEAVSWYIVKELMLRMMMADTSYAPIYKMSDEKWNFYVNGAACRFIMSNRDGLEAIVSQHLRTLPIGLWRNPDYRRYTYPQGSTIGLNNFVAYTPNGNTSVTTMISNP